DELDIFAAKHVAFARCEVPEGHFEAAADFCFQMMHGAGKAVGRKPFRERVRLEERAIDFLWAGCQNAVQAYGVGHARSPHELTKRMLTQALGIARIGMISTHSPGKIDVPV